MAETTTFDFDRWSQIAREDPERFEEMRSQLLRETLDQAPAEMRQRLEGLQWRIDRIRAQASHPLGACMRISSLMWEVVLGERGLATHLRALASGEAIEPAIPAGVKSAAVVELRQPSHTPR